MQRSKEAMSPTERNLIVGFCVFIAILVTTYLLCMFLAPAPYNILLLVPYTFILLGSIFLFIRRFNKAHGETEKTTT